MCFLYVVGGISGELGGIIAEFDGIPSLFDGISPSSPLFKL